MNLRSRQRDSTRKAILEALAEEIAESGFGFSIQAVADRAGVTHRTVYNHFPTREALNDAFAVYVEEELGNRGVRAPDEGGDLSLAKLGAVTREGYRLFAEHDAHLRAYVVLMLASRTPSRVAVDRTERFAALLRKEVRSLDPVGARLVAAALRMFLSSTGYHILTEQLQLSSAEASAVSEWVIDTLVAAVKAGKAPHLENDDGRSRRG